jgi:hypothetical protein
MAQNKTTIAWKEFAMCRRTHTQSNIYIYIYIYRHIYKSMSPACQLTLTLRASPQIGYKKVALQCCYNVGLLDA